MIGRAIEWNGLPVHFTYEEGQFGYDCNSPCMKSCCHGVRRVCLQPNQAGNVEMLGGSLAAKRVDGSGVTHVEVGMGRCPALDREGSCRIHKEHGWDSKPTICALYPFNMLRHAGSFLVVGPNFGFSCPMEARPREGVNSPSHKELLGQIRRRSTGEGTELFIPIELPSDHGTTYEHENAFFAAVARDAGRRSSLEIVISSAMCGSAEVLQGLALASQMLNVALPTDAIPGDGELALMLPTLRVELFGWPSRTLERALAITTAIVWAVARHRETPPGVREIASIFHDNTDLASVLARSEEKLILGDVPTLSKSLDAEVALEAMVILGAIRDRPGELCLAELLDNYCRSKGAARITLLRELAANLGPKAHG
jgi:Fe-S-cluster containining protein